ncbi:MAG TPA: 3-mercaptopyruvate sulfurtransferase [Stellaceae bacterium]|nr:3-mercaptopyruvate sulfurtransferase [Stellaceae bacterium]
MAYAHPESLVSTEWLAARLGDPKVTILDASFKLPGITPTASEDYARGHIPGAVYFDIDAVADHANPLPHMLPRPEEFARIVGALGIGDGQTIVIYDGAGTAATRAWWMLRVMGHAASVLDGGLRKWKAENRPVTADVPRPPQRRFTPHPAPTLVRDRAQLVANLTARREQVVDARSPPRFAGSAPEPRPGLRAGHIPGAVNLPWEELNDPKTGTVLPAEALEARLRRAGLKPEQPVVASCGSGVSACVVAFAIHLVGWPEAAVYDGSWSEWGLPGDTPIATGAA